MSASPLGRALGDGAVAVAAYLVGSVPFAEIAAHLVAGADLREQGTGTVSGTGLYEVAGFGPLAVAGTLDVAKGAVAAVLARRRGTGGRILAAAAVVAGHNWSVFLGGAGGRGISPTVGYLLVAAPEGAVLLLTSLVAGRLASATASGGFIGQAALPFVLSARRGRSGAMLGLALTGVMWVKRIAGNEPPRSAREALHRLLHDRDSASRTSTSAR